MKVDLIRDYGFWFNVGTTYVSTKELQSPKIDLGHSWAIAAMAWAIAGMVLRRNYFFQKMIWAIAASMFGLESVHINMGIKFMYFSK